MKRLRFKYLISRRARATLKADIARDRGNAAVAATLYEGIIRKWGVTFGLLMQLGNALKDSGEFEKADQIYAEALTIRPDDGDAYLQRGHLMKIAGEHGRALEFYQKAMLLDKSLTDAEKELYNLRVSGRLSGYAKMVSRSDIPLQAGVLYERIINQNRWRRG
jgi:tetratricopeptide (TPR) repeat protein